MKKVLFAITLVAGFSVAAQAADEKMSREDIAKAIKPVGQLHIGDDSGPAVPAGPRTGDEVYEASCKMCHAAGVSGAPKKGDVAEWAKRGEQGIDAIYEHAIKGFNSMPPMGTCMTCSEDEIKAAVDFMMK